MKPYGTLAEMRLAWETKCRVILEVPVEIESFQKLYVVLRDMNGHRLHRYIKGSNGWDCSVDCTSGLDECLEVINSDLDLYHIKSGLK